MFCVWEHSKNFPWKFMTTASSLYGYFGLQKVSWECFRFGQWGWGDLYFPASCFNGVVTEDGQDLTVTFTKVSYDFVHLVLQFFDVQPLSNVRQEAGRERQEDGQSQPRTSRGPPVAPVWQRVCGHNIPAQGELSLICLLCLCRPDLCP